MPIKNILVTGASSGIGLKFAQMAELQGYNVIYASRKTEDINLLNATSAKVILDVCNEESVKKTFEKIGKKYGNLDALINCAGFVQPENMITTSLENWNMTLATNLTGTFLCCKYAVPLLKKSCDGKIINIASTAGMTPRPGWSAYAASKSGVISFSSAISEELSVYNIKVFVISPGRTATPLRTILAPNEDPTTIMQPESVANIILFCLTDKGTVIEGQPIIVRERF